MTRPSPSPPPIVKFRALLTAGANTGLGRHTEAKIAKTGEISTCAERRIHNAWLAYREGVAARVTGILK